MRNLCVVLVEPTLPENVGAVARVMDNMGIRDLRLVTPCDYRSAGALAVAGDSRPVLETAREYASLKRAVADCEVAIATSGRVRSRTARWLPVSEIGRLIPAGVARVAVVFGRESHGLSNEEVAVCHGCIRIPTAGQRRSLNLSHAVVVVLYEWMKLVGQGTVDPAGRSPRATVEELEGVKEHLFEVLVATRFLRGTSAEVIRQGFADLLGRAQPTRREVRLVRGLFHRVLVALRRGPGSRPEGDRPIRPSGGARRSAV